MTPIGDEEAEERVLREGSQEQRDEVLDLQVAGFVTGMDDMGFSAIEIALAMERWGARQERELKILDERRYRQAAELAKPRSWLDIILGRG